MVKSKPLMEKSKKTFNHIKIHTQYSICEGAIKIDELSKYCKDNKIKTVGMSDTSNLCGSLEFSEQISKSKTQPIICLLYTSPSPRDGHQSRMPSSA